VHRDDGHVVGRVGADAADVAHRVAAAVAHSDRELGALARDAGAAEIDRITAERDYMRLHVGSRSWLINDSMTRLEEELDPALFVRLHRSGIVRKDFITGMRRDDTGRWFACLADGEEQKVGRLYLPNARALTGRN